MSDKPNYPQNTNEWMEFANAMGSTITKTIYDDYATTSCKNCNGHGWFMYREGQPEDPILNPRYTCPSCHGTGRP